MRVVSKANELCPTECDLRAYIEDGNRFICKACGTVYQDDNKITCNPNRLQPASYYRHLLENPIPAGQVDIADVAQQFIDGRLRQQIEWAVAVGLRWRIVFVPKAAYKDLSGFYSACHIILRGMGFHTKESEQRRDRNNILIVRWKLDTENHL